MTDRQAQLDEAKRQVAKAIIQVDNDQQLVDEAQNRIDDTRQRINRARQHLRQVKPLPQVIQEVSEVLQAHKQNAQSLDEDKAQALSAAIAEILDETPNERARSLVAEAQKTVAKREKNGGEGEEREKKI